MLIGRYKDAALMYEYGYFNSTNQADAVTNLLSKSYCEKQASLYKESLNTLQRIPMNNLTDTGRFDIWTQKAVLNYLLGDFGNSMAEINNIKDNLGNNYSDSNLILEVLSLNQLREWEVARNRLKSNPKFIFIADSMYQIKPLLKNVELAKVLSCVIPGSGQIYAGYPVEGLLSIGFIAASVYGGVSLFNYGFYFSSISTGAGLTIRFYQGGANRAKYLAEKKNTQRSEKFNNMIKNQLLK